MILGITIHRPMKKNLEHFRFSRHFPRASTQFSKSDLCIISLASGRQNHQKNKNAFFIFSGIQIHGRLTKKHEHFRFSRHFPPVSKQFPKSDLYLMPLPSAHENRQETQHFHVFENFGFFLITLDIFRKPTVFFILRFL